MVSAQGSAAANNGSTATVDNTNNSDNSQTTASGDGAAAAQTGNATSTYSVNNSDLSGTVTGAGVATTATVGAGEAVLTASNTLNNAFNGAAGINQSIQNNGANAMAQQQVSFQGNVNVGQ